MQAVAPLQPAVDSDPAFERSPDGKTLLQERLAEYGRVLPLVAAPYFVACYLTWSGHPGVSREALLSHIFSPWSIVILLVHLAPWLACRGRALAQTTLLAIDLLYCTAVGIVYCGILSSHPSPPIAPLECIPALATVLGVRALVVPSSGARTAVAGILMGLSPGIFLYAAADHFSAPYMGVRTSGALFITWISVAVALTAFASQVLYGLRRDVKKAQRFGQYTLVERLGEGGMGTVYRAEHAMLRRPTAVKLMRRAGKIGDVARFEREVQLMSELTHPNTVAIHDYGRTANGGLYYAMEFLDGIDLEGVVAIGGPQSPARVVHVLRQVCGSLQEAHERDLIHRDIKPANVFLCRARSEPDTIKVLDFGLVKHIASAEPAVSTENSVIGTPLYMSPEAFVRPTTADARSDLYSLGAVAYLLLTGTGLFDGKSFMEVGAKQVYEAPERPSERLGSPIPEDLENIVLACLAKEPERRPASAEVLRAQLDACACAGEWKKRDAEAWWGTHGLRIDERRRSAGTSATDKTVLVDLVRSR